MLCMQVYLLLVLPGQLSSLRKKSDGSAHTSVWVIRLCLYHQYIFHGAGVCDSMRFACHCSVKSVVMSGIKHACFTDNMQINNNLLYMRLSLSYPKFMTWKPVSDSFNEVRRVRYEVQVSDFSIWIFHFVYNFIRFHSMQFYEVPIDLQQLLLFEKCRLFSLLLWQTSQMLRSIHYLVPNKYRLQGH